MTTQLCPWLGSEQDREIRHAEPAESHLCFARTPAADVELDFQAGYCLSARYRQCRFYREPPEPLALPTALAAATAPEPDDDAEPGPGRSSVLRTILWTLAILCAVAVILVYGLTLFRPEARSTPTPVTISATPSPTASPSEPAVAETAIELPPTGTPALEYAEQTPPPTPYPGGAVYSLSPGSTLAGWVASDESYGNHLGDSYLYSGVFDGVIYHGILQIDLSAVAPGAQIHSAVLELAGLDDRRLGTDGVWQVRVLSPDIDDTWSEKTFQEIHNSEPRWTLLPALAVGDLQVAKINSFTFSAEQVADLEQRLLAGHPTVSFRIDGPLAGANCVFAWDGGSGSATSGVAPRLFLSVGAPPETPIATGTAPVVVVTNTPTPASVFEAAIRSQTATAVAATTGQPTPTPILEWTATPTVIVTSAPTPASSSTAAYQEALATAVALTTGTYTPTPQNLITATPTPLWIPFDQITPTPTPRPPTPSAPVPSAFAGKILFQSDRASSAGPWLMESDGQGIGLLTSAWPYAAAAARETLSGDGSLRVQVGTVDNRAALLVEPVDGGDGEVVVIFRKGSLSAPVWSPVSSLIAFVADSGDGGWLGVVQRDGKGLKQLTYSTIGSVSHPTFSPDGTRLAFTVTNAEGRRQIWAVNVDGSGAVNLSSNSFDDWDPVWVK